MSGEMTVTWKPDTCKVCGENIPDGRNSLWTGPVGKEPGNLLELNCWGSVKHKGEEGGGTMHKTPGGLGL